MKFSVALVLALIPAVLQAAPIVGNFACSNPDDTTKSVVLKVTKTQTGELQVDFSGLRIQPEIVHMAPISDGSFSFRLNNPSSESFLVCKNI